MVGVTSLTFNQSEEIVYTIPVPVCTIPDPRIPTNQRPRNYLTQTHTHTAGAVLGQAQLKLGLDFTLINLH